MENGHWLLWDNGNVRPEGQWSRGAEYIIDAESMEITLVWEYRIRGKIYLYKC